VKVVRLEREESVFEYELEGEILYTYYYWKGWNGQELFPKEAIINTTQWLPKEEFLRVREKAKQKGFKQIQVVKQKPEYFRERVKEIFG